MANDVDRYLSGVPCWLDSTHPDVPAAVAFYSALFGWEVREADGRLVASLGGQDVAGLGGPPAGPGGPAWVTSIRVDDAAEATAAVRQAGGSVLAEPTDVGTAGRTATVADPAGAVFRLWQAGRHRGAALVNADGTWNWSNLQTPDRASATRFYGQVFGWRELDLGGMSMWVRPGYEQRLDELDPSRRERHAHDGVPEGFGDCIGWLVPAEGAARWTVTFAVADTDKTVELAESLGATVRVAPQTIEPVRTAELTDPQGVEFAVNTYLPGRA